MKVEKILSKQDNNLKNNLIWAQNDVNNKIIYWINRIICVHMVAS